MLPTRWKIFRIVCILQIIFSGYISGRSLVFFINGGWGFFGWDIVCFIVILLFAALGLTMLQNNYPATLLETGRKRYFNILYILNLLLLSYIGAHIYEERWAIFLAVQYEAGWLMWLALMMDAIIFVCILFFQVRILFGMFWLRREMYANYRAMVEEIASEQVPD